MFWHLFDSIHSLWPDLQARTFAACNDKVKVHLLNLDNILAVIFLSFQAHVMIIIFCTNISSVELVIHVEAALLGITGTASFNHSLKRFL